MPFIDGDSGNNTIEGGDRRDTIFGEAGNDSLTGNANDDRLDGGAGDDTLVGGQGNDVLNGDFGADRLFGGEGDDNLSGYNGATLDGGAGTDHIFLTLIGFEPVYADLSTLIDGGEVAITPDTLLIDVESGLLNLSGGDDAIKLGDTAFDVEGNAGDDRIFGGAANSHLYGGAGDDLITPGTGSDYVDGGSGRDTVSYEFVEAGVVIDLKHYGGSVIGSGAAAFLGGIESAIGSGFADTIGGSNGRNDLYGGGGGDVLSGGANADLLSGGDGADTLDGGRGADRLEGGGGRDAFLYTDLRDSTASAADLITKIGQNETIDLSAIDADANADGDQAFVVSQTLTGEAGQLALRYDAVAHLTHIEGDVDGDGAADLVITVSGYALWYDHFTL